MTLVPAATPAKHVDPIPGPTSSAAREILSEDAFKRAIAIERKRSERSREPFLLMLMEAGDNSSAIKRAKLLDTIAAALMHTTRETDVIGWHTHRSILGVIYTGLRAEDNNSVLSVILNRVSDALRHRLAIDQFSQIAISFHPFPDDRSDGESKGPNNPALYPDLLTPSNGRQSALAIKRAIDLLGSLFLLLIFSPLLIVIALTVKLTSQGPVLFKQQRVGQFGKCFTFLKFRSMYVNCDHAVHRQFVTQLIASDTPHQSPTENGKRLYKLTNDKRITRIGKFLRKTSLDELPQFFNVLTGDMSLVGPRPPIPYELAVYKSWHRLRLGVKPGITGLWQVSGRSRVKFDDMVRLDLRYATSWSPWLDIKILLQTPLAVIKGAGAV